MHPTSKLSLSLCIYMDTYMLFICYYKYVYILYCLYNENEKVNTMPDIESKITRHTKSQENTRHNEKKSQMVETKQKWQRWQRCSQQREWQQGKGGEVEMGGGDVGKREGAGKETEAERKEGQRRKPTKQGERWEQREGWDARQEVRTGLGEGLGSARKGQKWQNSIVGSTSLELWSQW